MNNKISILVFLFLSFFLINTYAQNNEQVKTIVIDAGHGGHDSGCLGKKSKEKDVVLKMALKVGKLINEKFPDVKIIYTRKTDVFVELYRRAEIANNSKANLFISIHCNAAENTSAHGVETYVMGIEKSEASKAIAKRENSVILLEKNYETNYDGFDPNSPEANVIFSLYASAYLKSSAIMASKVQNNILKNTNLTDRTVRQAGYWVLYKVAMPSILVELGFLSNTKEENFLLNDDNQNTMAYSICNGFIEYKNQMEGTSVPLYSLKNNTPATSTPTPTHPSTQTPTTPSAENPQSTSHAENQTTPSSSNTSANSIRFKVQFMALPESISTSDKRFAGLPDVNKYFENKYWKYTAGNVAKYEDILPILKTVKKQYGDAFVVAFKGDKKIPVAEARNQQ